MKQKKQQEFTVDLFIILVIDYLIRIFLGRSVLVVKNEEFLQSCIKLHNSCQLTEILIGDEWYTLTEKRI